jgi:hypothetical protein
MLLITYSTKLVISFEAGKACRTHWNEMNAHRILVGKPEGRKPLGRNAWVGG